jgi:hypothetical protein
LWQFKADHHLRIWSNWGVSCSFGLPYISNTSLLSRRLCVAALVLALPDFTKQFQVETDASDVGVGAVLMQQGHPLAFISKALGLRTKGLSTYEKEYLAILIVVD